MNLLEHNWIPVRTRAGHKRWIAPWQITEGLQDDPIVAIDAPRADFTGALMQFLIGLLQTAFAPEREQHWKEFFRKPPSGQTLQGAFTDYREFFNFGPERPSFMEDRDLDAEPDENIEALFVDGPGKSTVVKNRDFFVKSDTIFGVCPEVAAMALFTFQTNSPGRGTGYRGSIRKIGPLTTLISNPSGSCEDTLWHNLWANILDANRFSRLPGNVSINELASKFPWMEAPRISDKQGCKTTPEDAHPLITYWAMPCRIHLDWKNAKNGKCGITGRQSDTLISAFTTTNYGASYAGAWIHPLTPYKENKGAAPRPMATEGGGIFYRNWLGMTANQLDVSKPAEVIDAWFGRRSEFPDKTLYIHAYGYDMKSAEARCWYESKMPLYYVVNNSQRFIECAANLIKAAETVGKCLQYALIQAWFGNHAPSKAFQKTSFCAEAFWQTTEGDFYTHLKKLAKIIDKPGLSEESLDLDPRAASESWLYALQSECLRLFNQWVATGYFEVEDPRRASEAYNKLMKSLNGPKLRTTLDLPANQKAA